jgi:diaminohydroxyphosphoribosylaminopyrimidine deaminase / 5-amino-6-(5-phosphoribosylamino)uracil reductase
LIAPRAGYIYHASQNDQKISALVALGVKLIYMPEATGGKVNLAAMMRDLAINHEINELHVEAGFKLNGALIKAGLVDEMLIYMAPKLLGPGMGWANLPELASLVALPEAQNFAFQSAELVGEAGQKDLRIIARTQQSIF